VKDRILDLINDPNLAERSYDNDFVDDLRDALSELTNASGLPGRMGEIVNGVASLKRTNVVPYPQGQGLIIWGEKGRVRSRDGPAAPVTLSSHSDSVERIASEFCIKTLPSSFVVPMKKASALHVTGKADIRFQALLRGGDIRAAAAGTDLLAKSDWLASTFTQYEQARIRAGYPKGGRHELLSARLAEQIELGVERDLILHLISSHHGRCRPFAPVVWDQSPREVTLETGGSILRHSSDTGMDLVGSGVGDRFWEGIRRFGWWGEAYLEAILRLADHRSSEYDLIYESADEEGLE